MSSRVFEVCREEEFICKLGMIEPNTSHLCLNFRRPNKPSSTLQGILQGQNMLLADGANVYVPWVLRKGVAIP